jgi:YjbE family integral membrane protein
LELSTNLDTLGLIAQICLIDLLLSGDNAIVIALACRELPPDVRRRAIWIGTGVAVGSRVILTFAATLALRAPYLRLIGAGLLLLIAIELLAGQAHGRRRSARSAGADAGIWRAVGLIVVADAVMSVDNVVAVAAAAQDSFLLLFLGLLISVPILVFSSLLIGRIMESHPVVVQGGAALLGWIAGKTAVADPAIATSLAGQSFGLVALAPILGALYVWIQGGLLRDARSGAANPLTLPSPPVGERGKIESSALPLGRRIEGDPSALPLGNRMEGDPSALPLGNRREGDPSALPLGKRMEGDPSPLPLRGRGAGGEGVREGESQKKRFSRMDLTIYAGVAVPLLGLVAMIVYILAKAIAGHGN